MDYLNFFGKMLEFIAGWDILPLVAAVCVVGFFLHWLFVRLGGGSWC